MNVLVLYCCITITTNSTKNTNELFHSVSVSVIWPCSARTSVYVIKVYTLAVILSEAWSLSPNSLRVGRIVFLCTIGLRPSAHRSPSGLSHVALSITWQSASSRSARQCQCCFYFPWLPLSQNLRPAFKGFIQCSQAYPGCGSQNEQLQHAHNQSSRNRKKE